MRVQASSDGGLSRALRRSLVHAAMALWPRFIWRHRVRTWNIPRTEPELDLLPVICDSRKLSIDVGASDGMYTMHMLQYSKGCLSFEARLAQAEALRRALADSASVVRIEAVALSDHTGVGKLCIARNDPGRSTIEPANALERGDDVQEVSVPTRRLDDYGLKNIGCIKIDVEGHELAVLVGGRRTIERTRPFLIIEIEERHFPGATTEVPAYLKSMGYTGHFIAEGILRDIESFEPSIHQMASSISGGRKSGMYINNFIFAPPGSGKRLKSWFGRT